MTKNSHPQEHGRVIFHGFGSDDAFNDRLSRVCRIRETSSTGTIQTEYAYHGAGRVAKTDYPVPQIESRAYNLDGSGGNYHYNAFDRFGREAKREWWRYGSSQFRDRFDYTYDYAGNRTSRDIPTSVNSGNNLDQAYTYDGLQRLKTFDQGTLSGTSISGTPANEEDYTLDQCVRSANRIFVLAA